VSKRYVPAVLVLADLMFGSCARQAARPAVDRIAILRFENLSQDNSADWMGRAFSDIITAELSGASGIHSLRASLLHGIDRGLGVRPISAPGISSERTQALLAGAHHIGYGEYTIRGGRVEARLTMEDAATGKVTKVISVSAPEGDVLGAATDLARQLPNSPGISPYGTRNAQALRAYVTGTEAGDPAAAEVALNLAIAADPDFAAPYESLAQFRAQRADRSGALAILEQAEARGKSIPEVTRARLEVLAAELRGDRVGRQNALASVVKLDPGDSTSWRALGEQAYNRHQYRPAMQALQRASELEPGDIAALNLLGYVAAYAGELETGMAALRRYQTLRPNDANPLDSMGDINLAVGRLTVAESFYLQAQKKDRNSLADGDLLKAAAARLMSGDVTGADGLAKQYLDARTAAKDPLVAYRQAEWTWIGGRRKAACQQMAMFAAGAQNGPLREVASRANAELTIWSLMLGDRPAAVNTTRQAMALAGPSSVGVAVVADFLTQPAASSQEWVVRAEQKFSGGGQAAIKDFALAWALLLNRQFQPAQLLLQQMWDNGTPAADEGLPVLLAWAYLESDHTQRDPIREAAPLLRFNPVPNAAGLGPFMPFYLPRLFYLRGLAAQREGKRDEARANYGLFLKLSGPDSLIWGEEQRAQAASR
jgi:tetratricopeptide (TPR) repeat protein